MNPNKELWERGDFTRIAQSMRESGEALVNEFGIRNGLKALDLGCGKDQLRIYGATAGRIRQPYDVGSRKRCD